MSDAPEPADVLRPGPPRPPRQGRYSRTPHAVPPDAAVSSDDPADRAGHADGAVEDPRAIAGATVVRLADRAAAHSGDTGADHVHVDLGAVPTPTEDGAPAVSDQDETPTRTDQTGTDAGRTPEPAVTTAEPAVTTAEPGESGKPGKTSALNTIPADEAATAGARDVVSDPAGGSLRERLEADDGFGRTALLIAGTAVLIMLILIVVLLLTR